MTQMTDEILNRIATAMETERNFRTGEVRELQRIAEAMEEILRQIILSQGHLLVKSDLEKYEKKNKK